MILQIIAGAVFSLTFFMAARDFPPKTKLSAIIAAAVLSGADLFMITRFAAASEEYDRLLSFLAENKAASISYFPDFMTSFVEGLHDFIIKAAELLRDGNTFLCEFWGSRGETAAFVLTAFTLSAAAILLLPEKKEPDSETIGPARAVGIMAYDLFSGSFLSSPAVSVIIFFICRGLNIEYAAVICTVMWILSYIPIIGQAVGIILGICILAVACHPVQGIIFGVLSAVIFILLSYGKNLIEGFSEIKEQNKST